MQTVISQLSFTDIQKNIVSLLCKSVMETRLTFPAAKSEICIAVKLSALVTDVASCILLHSKAVKRYLLLIWEKKKNSPRQFADEHFL